MYHLVPDMTAGVLLVVVLVLVDHLAPGQRLPQQGGHTRLARAGAAAETRTDNSKSAGMEWNGMYNVE